MRTGNRGEVPASFLTRKASAMSVISVVQDITVVVVFSVQTSVVAGGDEGLENDPMHGRRSFQA